MIPSSYVYIYNSQQLYYLLKYDIEYVASQQTVIVLLRDILGMLLG